MFNVLSIIILKVHCMGGSKAHMFFKLCNYTKNNLWHCTFIKHELYTTEAVAVAAFDCVSFTSNIAVCYSSTDEMNLLFF